MIEKRYAQLLIDYCLEIQEGDRLLIQTTTLAEPLVREVYRIAMRRGAHPVTRLEWREQTNIYYKEAGNSQLGWLSPLEKEAFTHFEAYLYMRAPFNLSDPLELPLEKQNTRKEARKTVDDAYKKRTATRDLKRCLCQYPTQAAAQVAGMSLEKYQHFIYNACKLYDDDPRESWLEVRRMQNDLVSRLNKASEIRFVNNRTDIICGIKNRVWINSDGQTNMPSGEVYSSPIEDEVDGVIHFDQPTLYRGQIVSGITLKVEKGEVKEWDAIQGRDVLDQVFTLEGTRRFGEVAIGTNYHIPHATKNILFDEKMGGTIHMAVGQAYLQTGGKNYSSVHWDMIANMKEGGKIFLDGDLIYRDGYFL